MSGQPQEHLLGFDAREMWRQITPSVSAGTVSPAPRPLADAWGYLDRQWIGSHHTFVGRRPIATGCKPAPQALAVSTSSRKCFLPASAESAGLSLSSKPASIPRRLSSAKTLPVSNR